MLGPAWPISTSSEVEREAIRVFALAAGFSQVFNIDAP
jgi:hypothetical protein